jgi:hypothetical protein
MTLMSVHPMDEQTHLEERVLVLGLELVWPKELETALGLGLSEALLVTLEEDKNVVKDDSLEINLVLVVQILSIELNLNHVDQ